MAKIKTAVNQRMICFLGLRYRGDADMRSRFGRKQDARGFYS